MSHNQDPTPMLIRRILSDIRVEMGDEFDRNFERQAYFSEKWQRRRSPSMNRETLLVDTGTLRRSIRSRTTETSVIFESTLPYASIHNEGGEIVVTARMKRYFWVKYYETQGAFSRTKGGTLGKSKRNAKLSTQAEFYKHMALMKVGRTIRIPRRQFLGQGEEVERLVRGIVEDTLTSFFAQDYHIKLQ